MCLFLYSDFTNITKEKVYFFYQLDLLDLDRICDNKTGFGVSLISSVCVKQLKRLERLVKEQTSAVPNNRFHRHTVTYLSSQ